MEALKIMKIHHINELLIGVSLGKKIKFESKLLSWQNESVSIDNTM